MRNYRFRLSDMMPNAWFYKLRDMSKSRSHNPKLPSPVQKSRKSIQTNNPYTNPKTLDTHFPNHDPPRKSCKKRPKRKTVYMPSPRKQQQQQQQQSIHNIPVWLKPQTLHFHDHSSSPDDYDNPHHRHQHQQQHIYLESDFSKLSSSDTDIIIDVDETSYSSIKVDSFSEFNMIPEPELPPILTKPAINNSSCPKHHIKGNSSHDRAKKNKRTTARKSISRSGGVKIRANGPKVGSRKIEGHRRRSNVEDDEKKGLFYTESFAVVKASIDPERDFMESMMEMIVENNIRASKELEDLLACYLSLNSNQYHDLIIKAFEQIWFNMPQPHF